MDGAKEVAVALARRSDEELMLAATRERGFFSGSQPTLTRPEAAEPRVAFEELVARHRAFAMRRALHVLENLQDAEDVVQEVWRALWETRAQYRVKSRFVEYLTEPVVWRSCDLLKTKQRRAQPPEESLTLDELPGRELPPCDAAMREDDAVRVRIAVAALPSRQQRAVGLRFRDDLSNKEIASEMRASVKSVEHTLGRACATLRDLLSSESGESCPAP
jgi:RNA polymerase sigma-70 factor, ECF subfamily